jgi:FkbM family methyltransferase
MRAPFTNVRGHTIYAPGLGDAPVVVDIGANRGEFSQQLKSRFGGTYRLYEANADLLEHIPDDLPVEHCAVTDRDGSIEFNVAANDEGSSVLDLPAESTIDVVKTATVTVPALSLERIISTAGRVDLLKMDIEGAEVVALPAVSGSTLRDVGQITVEFHSDPFFGYDIAEQTEQTIAHIASAGFHVFDFSPDRTDVLFVNRSRFPLRGRVGFFRAWARVVPPLRWRLNRWRGS